jgi:hypothetical protein
MRSAVHALAWEFWSTNRRGWLLLMGAIPSCALLYRLAAEPLHASEDLKFFGLLPMVISLILAAAFCNFTDQIRREGVAGFPRHLFVLPVSTCWLVTSAIASGVLSVVGLYVAWVKLVLQPVDIVLLVRWPATLLAAFVVFYQTIIWCLCGFRLTRIVSLSVVATTLVGISFLPMLVPKPNLWASEGMLSAILAALVAGAYGIAVVTVGMERRGSGLGWTWPRALVETVVSAIPHRRPALRSADAALLWIEWRRTGLVLPAAVLLATGLVLGSVILFTDRGRRETMWAESWLAVLPLVLAVPIGMGFGKPDFWSLDLTLSPFVAARPVSGGQLLAAKMKAAACSTLIAWCVMFLVAPLCIYLYCDTEHWRDFWRMSGIIYSPFSQWALLVLGLVMAILLTWSLMIGSVWLGYSGRPVFYYSFAALGITALMAVLIVYAWWLQEPRDWADTWVRSLAWMPWVLATVVIVKVWLAVSCSDQLRRRGLISSRSIATYMFIWLAATACLVLRAALASYGIEWFRNILILAALCVVPAARIALTPLTIAWNRHR